MRTAVAFALGSLLLGMALGCAEKKEEEDFDIRRLSAADRPGFDELVAAAVRWRGLEPPNRVRAGVQGREGWHRRLRKLIAEELPPDLEAHIQRALFRFGLIPEELDLSEAYLELLTEQTAGYFDSEYRAVVLVEDVGARTGAEDPVAAKLADLVREGAAVHEIVHFLQHRHFDLDALFASAAQLDDRSSAVTALVEGDASLVTFDFMLGVALARLPMADLLVDLLTEDTSALIGSIPGNEAMATAPVYLRENLLFPYRHGLVFSLRLRQAGGQKLLDYAFAHDPPASSEQILHPEKWLADRDPPVEIALPEPRSALGRGWRQAVIGSWGELNTRLILGQRLASDEAEDAAAGWGGDAFALWRKGKREAVVWVTEWDDRGEAGAFHAAAVDAFDGWQVRIDGTRVALVSAELRPKKLGELFDALFAAPARRPPVTGLDLAALGIGDDDRPQPLSSKEMRALRKSSRFAEIAALRGESEVSDRAAALIERAMKDKLLEQAGIDDSPQVREMLDATLFAEPPPSTIEDGVLRVPEVGLRLELPPWRAQSLPRGHPMRPVVLRADMRSRWQLMVLILPLLEPAGLETLAGRLERQLAVQGLEKVSDGFVDRGGQRAYRLEAAGRVGRGGGRPAHTSIRFYSVGGYVVQIQAMGPPEGREAARSAVERTFASIAFE